MASNSQPEPSPETRQAQFEQGVAISLHLWLSLTIAVQNNWGGPSSADKRDWLAGAVADMFPSFVDLAAAAADDDKPKTPNPNLKTTTTKTTALKRVQQDPPAEDVEATLLQVMWDEFEANVDDGSEVEVADRVLKIRAQCAAGSFELVEDLRRRWLATKGKKVVVEEAAAGDQETDWESADDDDDDDGDDGSDVDMGDAPALVAVPKEKPPPEVDEDGFTTVTRKKR